jgi:cytochrome P450
MSQTVEDFAKSFHLWDPELSENPYPALERLQSGCPVAHSEMFGGYWIVTKYSDIRDVVSNTGLWSSLVAALPAPPNNLDPINNIPVGIDPPEHTAYRRVLGPVFSPTRVAAHADELRSRARDLIADMKAHDGPIDFLKEFAIPFPVITILHTCGLPEDDLDLLLGFKQKLFDDQYHPDPEVRQQFVDVTRPIIYDYFEKQIERRRGPDAPDDALTAIVRSKYNDERDLTLEEIVSIATLLLSAGLDTVTATLSSFITWFIEHPERWQEIIDHPERIPGAVEELLRIRSIVTLHRHATADTMIGSQAIKAGEFVQLSLPAAGFDPDEFPNPHTVDFQRAPNRHMAFGGGPHRCFGSNLARAELKIALEELSAAFSSLSYPDGYKPSKNWGLIMNILDLQVVGK